MDNNKSYKVLVVEDEGLIAHDISTRLIAMGHEVVGNASTAEEALEMAAEADLVLMDIRIDGPVDGIEAAARIRERHHLPVVFLSAHSDRPTLDRAKITGAFAYLVKPVAQASLHTAIEIAIYKHQAERQLEEREALLRTTLSSVADAVVVTDDSSRILMMNGAAEALSGWKQEEAVGKPVLRVLGLVDIESGETVEDPVPLAILKDTPIQLDRGCQLVSRSGLQMRIEGSAAPVKASGTALGTVLTFRDVSGRLWEEEQLRQAQKVDAAGRLAARVSEEYSSLLANIRTQSEQLLGQFGEYSPARQSLEEIQASAAAAETLTRRLIKFGTRQAKEHSEFLSLNGMLRRMSRLIESVAGSRIEVSMRPSPTAGKIQVDPAQLEQAIMNLVLHSCSLMKEGGKLIIETGNTELPRFDSIASYVFLNIAHTGREPDMEKLFEPVSIAEDGLALATVHSIVTEHAGYISAQPTVSGCRYEVLLPRAAEPQFLEAGVDTTGVSSILLVDYRETVRSQLHNFFEAAGYNLLEAVDEQEALTLGDVHGGSLDLVVAEAADAERIGVALRRNHAGLKILRIVDRLETSSNEIRRPFTQAALLQKAAILLEERGVSAAATSSSA